jgi:hypothetical protein
VEWRVRDREREHFKITISLSWKENLARRKYVVQTD